MYQSQNNAEWNWLIQNAVDWDKIIPLYYPEFPSEEGFENKEDALAFYKELIQSIQDWSETSVKEIGFELDEKGAGIVKDGKTHRSQALEKLIKEATELQIFGLPIKKTYGGLETPSFLYLMMLNLTARYCMSSSTLLAFYTSIAEMIDLYCDEEKAKEFIPKIINGEISGSMNLTEPGCGSDLSMIKTSATPQKDGSYLLNGEKIFITNGGGGLAFVLAKVKGAPDTLDGLSMFFVKQNETDIEGLNYRVEKTEEKMGMHGSFTTVVTYDNTKASLVGKEGEGFKYMLHLMNEARICVGVQSLGGTEGALEYAENYAKERVAFGKPVSELPLMKRILADCRVEQDAIRALCVDTMSWFDLCQRLEKKKKETGDLSKEESITLKKAQAWTRRRTPLIKFYSTEAYVDISKKAVQVYGGYGFIKEYPVERYHRDSFGPILYEGTSQVQALMALKDTLKQAMKDPKSFLSSMFMSHPSTSLLKGEKVESKKFKKVYFAFKKNLLTLMLKTLKPQEINNLHKLKAWSSEENIERLMIHAETICWALSYTDTLRVLCQHAEKDSSRESLFHEYLTLVEPRLSAIYKDWEVRS